MAMMNYKKTVLVIQARMGSTRLPGKVMRKFNNGMTMLDVLLARVRAATTIDEISVALPWAQENDVINKMLHNTDLPPFRGNEEDVLDRVFRAAVLKRAGIFVRVCADNPLTSPEAIDRCVQAFSNMNVDYLVPEGLPLGTFAEIASIEAIERAWNETQDPRHREHVTSYILENPESFKIHRLKWEPSNWIYPRLTVDTENDFQLVNSIISKYQDPVQITLDKLKK